MKIVYYSVEWEIKNHRSPDEVIFNTKNLTKALQCFRDIATEQRNMNRPKSDEVAVTLMMNEITSKNTKRTLLMSAANPHYWVIEVMQPTVFTQKIEVDLSETASE